MLHTLLRQTATTAHFERLCLQEAKRGKDEKAAKDKEDADWADAGEGARSKAQLKKEEQARHLAGRPDRLDARTFKIRLTCMHPLPAKFEEAHMQCTQEKAREEAAKKKAEAKKLAEEEDAAMAAKAKKTPSKAATTPKARRCGRPLACTIVNDCLLPLHACRARG